MSKTMFERILQRMRLGYALTENEKEQLYNEIARRFSLIGLADKECEALEKAWETPNYRDALEKFILAWIEAEKKAKAKEAKKKQKKVVVLENGE